MSHSYRVAQLYLQAPGSLFIAFYDSQGYGGGILFCLHTGKSSIKYLEISRRRTPPRDFLANTETKLPLIKISSDE
jgi:hypothetical protein